MGVWAKTANDGELCVSVLLEVTRQDVLFKGFALQAINRDTGERVGQFDRDPNGAWRYQCLWDKAAITHSYNTDKQHLKVFWSVDNDLRAPISFV